MTTYRVTAERTRTGWWTLEAPQVGAVSQARRLDQVDEEMREAIAYLAGVPEDSFEIEVVPEIPREARIAMAHAEQLRAELQRVNREAAEESRRAARALADAKFTVRDIGRVMGISHQRAQQLVKSEAVAEILADMETEHGPADEAEVDQILAKFAP